VVWGLWKIHLHKLRSKQGRLVRVPAVLKLFDPCSKLSLSNAVDAIGWRADGLFVQLATYLTVIPL